jgi:hypothetical protein
MARLLGRRAALVGILLQRYNRLLKFGNAIFEPCILIL